MSAFQHLPWDTDTPTPIFHARSSFSWTPVCKMDTTTPVFFTGHDSTLHAVNATFHMGTHGGDVFSWVLTGELVTFVFMLLGIGSSCQNGVIEELSPKAKLITSAAFFHTSVRLAIES